MDRDNLENILLHSNSSNNLFGFCWWHWLVLAMSILLTIGAWLHTKTTVEINNQIEFDRQADQITDLIIERMHKYEDALWSGVAAIHSQSHNMSYHKWKKFSDTLRIDQRYLGINGIGVIYQVKPENLNNYLAIQKRDRPDYKIHPPHEYDVYFPITYIEPQDKNQKAVGLDMAHETNRREALIKARDTGDTQITAPIILVQDEKKTPGFLFYAPFYQDIFPKTLTERQNSFLGLVYTPFIFNKLIAGVLDEDKRHLSLKVLDNDTVLYDEHKDKTYLSKYYKKKILKFYGRDWVLSFIPNQSFYSLNQNYQPLIVLLGGNAISFLLFVIFLIMTQSNKKAFLYADKMSKNYQKKYKEAEDIANSLALKDKFLNLILDTIPSFIFVKDRDFKIIEANNAFIKNYPEDQQDQIIGYTTVEKYNHEEAQEFLKNDKIAFAQGFIENEEVITFPNGDVRTLLTKKIGFNSDGERFILGISNDITMMKKAEKEILRSNLELEKFAFIASHDLQEPLRMIKSFTEILAEENKDKFDDQGRFYLTHITSSAKRMQDLIRDLLNYSKIQESGLELKQLSAQKSLEEAIKNLELIINDSQAIVTYDDLPMIYSNNMHVCQLFQNLISNAIKYKKPDIIPKIHIGVEEKQNEYIFSIQDNGIGMQQTHLKQIFILFKRLHNKDDYQGTGIGLAICEKIVESLNGKIWVTSEVEKGSIFYFSIPKIKGK